MIGTCSQSASSYSRGCRCEDCTEAKRVARSKESRAARMRSEPEAEAEAESDQCSQSARSYRAGCRCEACIEDMRKQWRAPNTLGGGTTHFANPRDFEEAKAVAKRLAAKGLRNRAARVLMNLDGRWPAPTGVARRA